MANGEGEREGEQQHNGNLPDIGSVEQMFEGQEVPKWTEQLTPRVLVVSLFLGFFMTYLSMRLTLQSGESIAFNIFMAPLSFLVLKLFVTFMKNIGFQETMAFTRQENTVVHACLLACTSITLNGGFGNYYLAMNPYMALVYKDAADAKQMHPRWLIPFLFMVSFIGIFTVVPLAKVLLIRHNLNYPSGMTTGNIINSFHATNITPIGRKQTKLLLKSLLGALSWHMLNWWYSAGPNCGFQTLPVVGMINVFKGYHFNFMPSCIAVGLMSNPSVSISMLVGAIISWGFLWPYIGSKAGLWYAAGQPTLSLTGQSGYIISMCVAIALGDGVFHMGVVVIQVCYEFYIRRKQKHLFRLINLWTGPEIPSMSYDDRRRTNLFVQDRIPIQVALGGYILFATMSAIILPVLYPSLHSFQIGAAYILAPLLSFSNAYCTGLTDWNLASVFTKFTIFIFGAWTTGDKPGSVIAALAASGVVTAVVNTASDLMADFRTGYMTMTSPRSIFVAQIVGTAMGCIMAPICYMFFASASPGLLSGHTEYPAPFGSTYRIMAEFSVKGFTMLPKHSVGIAVCTFLGTIVINSVREIARGMKWRIYRFIPSLMPMAISFYSGPAFAFDMMLGCVFRWLWTSSNKRHAELFLPVVACGMIAGDAFSPIADNVLSRLDVQAPLCARVFSKNEVALVGGYLAKLV